MVVLRFSLSLLQYMTNCSKFELVWKFAFCFFSALSNVGRKAEAAKYLRLAAAYNPEYNQLLEQLENDDGEFVSDLSSSRRRDY